MGWPAQSITFDIATPVGTLAAVVRYFRATIYVVSDKHDAADER